MSVQRHPSFTHRVNVFFNCCYIVSVYFTDILYGYVWFNAREAPMKNIDNMNQLKTDTVPITKHSATKHISWDIYRQISMISRTKSHNYNVSSCGCFCAIHINQVLSRKWRCCWSSAARQYAPTTSEWPTIWLPTKVRLILEVWR